MRMNAGVSYLRPADNRCLAVSEEANCGAVGINVPPFDRVMAPVRLLHMLTTENGTVGPCRHRIIRIPRYAWHAPNSPPDWGWTASISSFIYAPSWRIHCMW